MKMPFGANYSQEKTVVRVFSINPSFIELWLFDTETGPCIEKIPFTEVEDNIYEAVAIGDHLHKYYNICIERNQKKYLVVDPYTKSTARNSKRGVIVKEEKPLVALERKHPEEIIIYESHVRDLTVKKSSIPGKFLGIKDVIEDLKDVGITHLHLLPVFDFASVDEYKQEYNWGYDPVHYFALERSYVASEKPEAPIVEFKQMVKDLHDAGISVVLDVVYNHTYFSEGSTFEILAPGYYYRMDDQGRFSNGSGVGCELKSENQYVSQLIIDSLTYFAKTFGIDGFRFDLMALTDQKTIQRAVEELKKINPRILIYGEPWMGGCTVLPLEDQTLKGTQRSKGFALFNDEFRECVKGDNDGTARGVIQGDFSKIEHLKKVMLGSIDLFCDEPSESINYLSSHDNLIFRDKLEISYSSDLKYLESVSVLGFSLLLFSFGIPFIQGGTEMLKTKMRHPNTYNMGDALNQLNFFDRIKYSNHYQKIREMIVLRKELQYFSSYKRVDIQSKVTIEEQDGLLIMQVHDQNTDVFYFNLSGQDQEIYPDQGIVLYESAENDRNQIRKKSVKIIRRTNV